MRTIETTFNTFGASMLLIGLKGESNATEILIDCADALEEYQGTMAAMSITGPDGTVYPGDISLDEDGVVHWVVAERDCGIDGHGSARVDLVDDNGTVVASAEADTMVIKTKMQNIAPDQIENWTEAASVALQEVRAALVDLINTDSTATANEAARQLAETGRVSAETLRASAETARASAETARATAETARASAETARATAETARASAETARIAAETARVSEFSTMQANAQAALSYIGPSEASSTASAAHAAGSYFIYNGKLYQATADIAIGDTITSGTNCAQVPGGAMGEVSNLKSAITPFYTSTMEQGALGAVNTSLPLNENDSNTRIRSSNYAIWHTGNKLVLKSGYEARLFLLASNYNYMTLVEWNQTVTSNNTTAAYAKVVIRKSNDENITPDEAVDAIIYDDFGLIKINPKADQSEFEKLTPLYDYLLKSGVVVTNSVGRKISFIEPYSNRVITYALEWKNNAITKVTSGYQARLILTDSNDILLRIVEWRQFVTATDANATRAYLVFKKDNNADILPSDIASALVVDDLEIRRVLPKASKAEFDELESRTESIETIISQYNLNRNMVGNSDMLWEYQNWTFPLIVSHSGIRNRVYFTFTSDAGYSGIAQYDLDTRELTKTILKANTNLERDDHDLIAVIITSYGVPFVAYSGGHSADRYMYVRMGRSREDIGTFGAPKVLESSGRTTYAQLFEYNNKIYMFYRADNTKWCYRIMTMDTIYMGSWSDETVFIVDDNNEQMYCQFTETSTSGVLRVCCYTNPTYSDTAIRMGFLHLDTMTLYDDDNSNVIGASLIPRTSVPIIIPAPTNGKVIRLYNAAKTSIEKTMILYCIFTNAEYTSDGEYYLYDDGNNIKIADAGTALWIPKAQLGVAWIGTNQIAVARGYEGYDWIEIYDYANGEITLNRVVKSHNRVSNGVQYYRLARPIIDNNNKYLAFSQGYFNPNSFNDEIMDAHMVELETDDQLF